MFATHTIVVSKCHLFRYDLDNSGAIDKVEMVKVMEAIYSMVDGNMKVQTTNAMYHYESQFASYRP